MLTNNVANGQREVLRNEIKVSLKLFARIISFEMCVQLFKGFAKGG